MNHRPMEHGRPASGKRKLKDLLLQKDNRTCADCGAADPKWAKSISDNIINILQTFDNPSHYYYIKKSFATAFQVLSVTLDEWSDDEIDAMVEVGGNSSANSIYEAFLPDRFRKPGPDAGHEERSKFIRSKYERQEFLKPSLRINSSNKPEETPKFSVQTSFSRKILDSFRSNSSKPAEGMVEFIGLLKVKVIKGTNLAIRDMMTSDPYVILTLGRQTLQTTVVQSNLNPVWNQELMLSVPQRYGPLQLQVFDHDLFSADDIMGEAEIDLQPLITSAMAFGDAGMFGNMQIGKWLKSNDNALIDDSTVNIVDGKIKQALSLKLQNVECGELDLELEWIPLDQ